MLNNEIGTYIIAQSIDINPTLIARVDGRTITAIVNGKEYIGNWDIVREACATSKIKKRKKLINNEIIQERTPEEVLSDVYGISKDLDYEIVYDPDDVWDACTSIATKHNSISNKSNFKLDDNTGSL